MTFLGNTKTVNIIGDGYIGTVNAWSEGLKLLLGEAEDPYRLVFTPIGGDIQSVLSVAGIFVRGEIDEVDRYVEQLKKKARVFVGEVVS